MFTVIKGREKREQKSGRFGVARAAQECVRLQGAGAELQKERRISLFFVKCARRVAHSYRSFRCFQFSPIG